MRLALVGPRGSGKTTVAPILSEKTGLPVVTTDDLFEKRIGAEIGSFVRANGWTAFREIEKSILKGLAADSEKDIILDCGGGAILDPGNCEILSRFDFVVYLKADAEVLVQRLQAAAKPRPPLTEEANLLDEVRHVLARRDFLYRAVARYTLDTTHMTPAEAAENIASRLRSERSAGS